MHYRLRLHLATVMVHELRALGEAGVLEKGGASRIERWTSASFENLIALTKLRTTALNSTSSRRQVRSVSRIAAPAAMFLAFFATLVGRGSSPNGEPLVLTCRQPSARRRDRRGPADASATRRAPASQDRLQPLSKPRPTMRRVGLAIIRGPRNLMGGGLLQGATASMRISS